MPCAELRDLLPEYALGTLDPTTRARVDQHLAWCAGCRKEAAGLADGVAGLGLSLPAPEPPGGLEDRVVAAVTSEARPPRRGRVAVVAALAAALVAGSLVWGVSTAGRDRPPDRRQSARDAVQALDSIERIFAGLAGDDGVESLRFAVVRGGPVGGGATRYIAPDGSGHSLLVLVGGLPQDGAPYRVVLRSGGATMDAGTLEVLGDGQRGLAAEFARSLAGFDQVLVLDSEGRRVLQGRFSS